MCIRDSGDTIRGQAMALSVILLVITGGLLLAIDRFDRAQVL